jgi:hypothetical protein
MPITREDVRRLALQQPHAVEMVHRSSPSFRVNLRIFCMMPNHAGPEEKDRVTLKLDREDQLNMFEAHPGVVTPARLYSHHGWTYLHLAGADEALARLLLRLAWTHVAPKAMVKASRLAM